MDKLETAARDYVHSLIESNGTLGDIRRAFIKGAEWQKEQSVKEMQDMADASMVIAANIQNRRLHTYDRKDYPEREKNKYHADQVLSVLIGADKNFDDECNGIQVAFKDNGELKDTNAPSLIFDKASRAKLRRLLYSAIDCLTDIDD